MMEFVRNELKRFPDLRGSSVNLTELAPGILLVQTYRNEWLLYVSLNQWTVPKSFKCRTEIFHPARTRVSLSGVLAKFRSRVHDLFRIEEFVKRNIRARKYCEWYEDPKRSTYLIPY